MNSLFLPPPTTNQATVTPQHEANADSGTTGNYICSSDTTMLSNVQPTSNGILVKMPNGSFIRSTHTATLNLPALPPPARAAHIFPSLAGSLLSIGLFCDCDLIAIYDKEKVVIQTQEGVMVLRGTRSPSTRLWMIDLDSTHHPGPSQLSTPPPSAPPTCHSAAASIHAPRAQEQVVALYHACLNWPSAPTFLAAVEKGYVNFPGLTAEMVRKYPPNATATAKGHLDQLRQGLLSTKPLTESADDWHPTQQAPTVTHVSQRRPAHVVTRVYSHHPPHRQNHTDLAGRFPITSLHGSQYMMIMYCEDANYIHVELMQSRHADEFVKAYTSGVEFFTRRGVRPVFERLDNETSKLLETYCSSQAPPISLQYVAPGMHRANKAERSIRTWKNHFLATLAGTDPLFPLIAWDELVPQAELTLNLMRSSGITPYISAWHQLNGPYNFDSTPIAPPGMRVVVHEKPDKRPSWGYHGVDGFYVSPVLRGNYRCFKVYVTDTKRTRITDTLSWHPPAGSHLPGASPGDDLISLLAQTAAAISALANNPSVLADQRQLLQFALPSVSIAFHHLGQVFRKAPAAGDERVPAPETTNLPSADPPAGIERVQTPCPKDPPPGLTMPPPRAATTAPVPTAPAAEAEQQRVPSDAGPTSGAWTTIARRPQKAKKTATSAAAPPAAAPVAPPAAPTAAPPAAPPARAEPIFARPRRLSTLPSRLRAMAAMAVSDNFAGAASVVAQAPVAPLTYKAAKKGPHRLKWERAESEEFTRLLEDYGGTIKFIHESDKPHTRKASYYNPQVKIKVKNGVEEFRVRGTYGGDKGDFVGDVTAWVADMTTLKLLLNATISEADTNFCCADIKDFYLGTPLAEKEYMRIRLDQIPLDIQERYNVARFARGGSVMVEVLKGIYGLKQAGKLAQDRLIKHLASHGYQQTRNTPCLFKHTTRPVHFGLVVDDFAIKYKGEEHLEHLLSALRELYTITVDREGSKFIGIKIVFDKKARTAELSMPNYIQKALERFGIEKPTRRVDSPCSYTQPVYGRAVQQLATEDNTEVLSAADTKFVQEVVGVIAYYARAVDPTMLTAVKKIGSTQANPTQAVLVETMHLLHYAATWPGAVIVYRASGMQLALHSDASYLSETRARSRAGGIHFLTDLDRIDDPTAINGAIECISTIIPSVVSSAFEAEYAAMYLNATAAEGIRATLEDLGYPQGPTPISSDNQCAVGVANRTVKQRRSKAIDMRYHWIRDRVAQKHFTVTWRPGKTNLADFFTKAHPVKHQREMRRFFVKD
jgi:hypothetical protein